MKKMIIVLMMFTVFVLSAQSIECECPIDGIYETTGLGWIDGVEYYAVPYSRIGVSYANKVIYINYDWNADGDLSDEQVFTYRAVYYLDCVKWHTHELGFGNTTFTFMVKDQVWRSLITADDGSTMIIDYEFVSFWE